MSRLIQIRQTVEEKHWIFVPGSDLREILKNVFGADEESDEPGESPLQSHCSYRQYRADKFYRSIKSRLIVTEVIKRRVRDSPLTSLISTVQDRVRS